MQTQTRACTRGTTPEAVFTPLGVSYHRSEVWLHLRVGGVERVYRPSQALGLAFLLSIHPDHEHWRAMYPSKYYHGRKVDWQVACADITRLCHEAGEYKPESST